MKIPTILLTLWMIMLIIGCSAEHTSKNEMIDTLKQEIERKQKSGDTLNMMEIISSDWDRMYVFGPYTPESKIQEVLGFELKENFRIDERDDINLLVFVKDNNVIQLIYFPRSFGDFTSADYLPIMADKAEALFEITPAQDTSGGFPLLKLAGE
jgi:hypothetical protein